MNRAFVELPTSQNLDGVSSERKKISNLLLYNWRARFEKWRMVASMLPRWFGAMMWSCIDWSAWKAEPAVCFVRQGSEHCASKEYCPLVGCKFWCYLSYKDHCRYCVPNGWGNCQEGQHQGPWLRFNAPVDEYPKTFDMIAEAAKYSAGPV